MQRRRTYMILSKFLPERSRTGERAFPHPPFSPCSAKTDFRSYSLFQKNTPAPEGSATWAALSLTPHAPSLAHRLRSFYQPQRTPEGLFEIRFKPATGLTTPEPDVNPCLRSPNFHQSFSLPLRSDPAPRSEGLSTCFPSLICSQFLEINRIKPFS